MPRVSIVDGTLHDPKAMTAVQDALNLLDKLKADSAVAAPKLESPEPRAAPQPAGARTGSHWVCSAASRPRSVVVKGSKAASSAQTP